jgi:cell division protein FtsW
VNAFRRTDRSLLGRWFWTVDRVALGLIGLLLLLGLVILFSASPAGAKRVSFAHDASLGPLFFFNRQLVYLAIAAPILIGCSMLSKTMVRRLGSIGFIVCLMLLFAVLGFGEVRNGSRRWIELVGFDLQPSEFLKPLFVIVTAWILAAKYDDPDAPAMSVAFALLTLVIAPLVMQPDLGQSALITMTFIVQLFLAGLALWRVAAVFGAGVIGMGLAYLTIPHVTSRIDRFLHGGGDTYQVDKAVESFKSGGLFGVGPGEGIVKFKLPEPHTDYIFSVAGEEFGLVACVALALLYLVIIVRIMRQVLEDEDAFSFLAAAGLTVQFGTQAFINMGVNLHVLPAKGMTLPFVSYGGSSLIASAIALGLVLALTRRNRHLSGSPYLTRGLPVRAVGQG